MAFRFKFLNMFQNAKEWVLTAAHCTHGAVSSYAYLGAHNLYSEEDGRLIIFTQVMILMMVMMMMVMVVMMKCKAGH